MAASIAIFYGSSTGNTEMAAEEIQEHLGPLVKYMADVAKAEPEELLDCDILLLGVSTWNIGEMQDDWDTFIPRMEGLDLTGKKSHSLLWETQSDTHITFLMQWGNSGRL